ncbi:unnamed protein product [Cylindrotheca closterium]|uniref:Uncharacterized protein n=1 Tax=Cylindrotheca closterium TaxID=2856 RepID=A0AAD2FER3_9STRA|nr:unnamed protein product [Cylindrotheca closterium]CAJ1939173.1 unnamed protein product [Cylindrotheca closterium]
MSHIRGWDDTTFHNRASLTVGRLARLKRREMKKQADINKQAELLRQQEREQLQIEFKKFHELAILETLEQIPKPAPKKSLMSKFVSALTPSWMSTSSKPSSKEDEYGDIMSTGTMDTQASDQSWFVTLD